MSTKLRSLALHAQHPDPTLYEVAITLQYSGIPYDVELWEFDEGKDGVKEIKGPGFLKINENGYDDSTCF
ncbi:hypothetical protein BDZ45DRAFT_608344 [Acephala macrosclerotiorum]|nr:hypothetical protein BDZ45DRAFT_608344 [Acephala macrosclerotiorum]